MVKSQGFPSDRRAELLASLAVERRAIAEMLVARRLDLLMNVELTIQQLKVVLLVASGTADSGRALAAHLHVSASTVSGMVDKLVDLGYLDRETEATDRRITHLRPSVAALALRDDVMGVRDAADDILRDLDESSLSALLDGTRAVRAALTARQEDERRALSA